MLRIAMHSPYQKRNVVTLTALVGVLAPVLLMGGLYAFGLTIPVPHFGRDYVLRLLLPDAAEQIGLPKVHGPQDASRPLVLIDPGHGGHDPGASGAGFKEKALALGLATALKDRLVEEGGIRVALTREDDTSLLPTERDDLARRLGADLFISIHADSAGELSGVSGASIYTLSNAASSEAAARFAARENAADGINGVYYAPAMRSRRYPCRTFPAPHEAARLSLRTLPFGRARRDAFPSAGTPRRIGCTSRT